ncbi:hypothetical protein Pst134EB_008136 [Puccinia striiformis f. sp. tritici]|nr:hypothetical protein Pst134EB_008136 [Puccinia striiformis f. sp. tritici]
MFSQHQMLKTILAAACFSLPTWAQSSPPAGALIVRQSNTGSGEHATISSAVAALAGLTGPKTIFVYPGSYAEQPLNLQGFSTNPTSTASNQVTHPNLKPVSSAVFQPELYALHHIAKFPWLIMSPKRCHEFPMIEMPRIRNVINSFGTGTDTQALALASAGQRQAFAFFSSFQDTVSIEGTAFFIGSRIEGAVDFVFGSGSAWFESVVLAVKASPHATVITAQRNSPGGQTAFVFSRSQVISAGATTGSTYLGRPWSEYASVVFQSCSLSDIINPAGWSVWAPNNPQTAHVRFQLGPGASTSARQFGTQRTSPVLIESILGSGHSSWAR